MRYWHVAGVLGWLVVVGAVVVPEALRSSPELICWDEADAKQYVATADMGVAADHFVARARLCDISKVPQNFVECLTGPGGTATDDCRKFDLECVCDGDVDLRDYVHFQRIVRRGPMIQVCFTTCPTHEPAWGTAMLVGFHGIVTQTEELDELGCCCFDVVDELPYIVRLGWPQRQR